jgi:hypothetical protein
MPRRAAESAARKAIATAHEALSLRHPSISPT